jgi:hypothetical protein
VPALGILQVCLLTLLVLSHCLKLVPKTAKPFFFKKCRLAEKINKKNFKPETVFSYKYFNFEENHISYTNCKKEV